jgi:hypothetical protein
MRSQLVLLMMLGACRDEHVFPLDELPVEAWTGGLPIEGDGRLLVWLAHAQNDWSNAVGFVRFRCEDCRLGDGLAKMRVPGYDEGMVFPGIELGSVYAALDFAEGEVNLTTTWRSGDFVLEAKVIGKLAKRAEDIALEGCVRFGPTAGLRERDPRMHAIVVTTGASQIEGEREKEHEVFAIEIGGTLGTMRRLGKVCSLEQVR